MADAGHQQDLRVGVEDHAVQPRVDQVDPRDRAPVAEQAGLDVFVLQRLLEQAVVPQVDSRCGDVVHGPAIQSQVAGRCLRRRRFN